MTISRRTFSKLAGAAALGSLVSTSAATHSLVAAQDSNNVLRLAMNVSDISTLDPHFANGTQDRAIVDMVFNGLVRFAPGDSTSFQPDIASDMPEPTENEDGTQTWSFTLNSGVMTHPVDGADSYELTVDDVLFSFQKASNPDSSGYAGDYEGWTFAVGDDGTFQVTVPEPISETLFLPKVANYSGGYIVPQKSFEAVGADGFITQPIGTGPFAFESHTPQQSVMLTGFADFFRGAPQLDGVEVRFIADTTSRELALQSGDVDVVNGLPEAQWVDRMNQQDGIVADTFGVGEVVWINLDTQHEILKDPKVREAIYIAIDRNNHVALSGEPVASPVFSVVPYDLMPGGLDEDEANEAGVNPTLDTDRAKELLAEAGYPDGFELELVASEQDAYRTNYEVLAEELRQIGIDVKLEVVQHAAMHDLIRQGRNAIVIYIAFRPTADTYLTQFFATDGGATNFSHFTVDDLRDQARTETDSDKQAELWKQANIEIQKNFAANGLMYVNQVYARSSRVDYGHELKSVVQLYPGIDETTNLSGEG
ncbi:MAG TPA: ABC transporter substrate-binding protein [Thermomicrobiales bacterium]|nr:ABC transporter substrate-binding protein [Thermomicrobiales bacterium]